MRLTQSAFFIQGYMKIYKHYFNKDDTPFKQSFQKEKKQHIVWYRNPYTSFLGHKTQKIKLFGLFTIYKG